jgi:acyl dehydratase
MKEGPFYEDLPVGTLCETAAYTMTREAIIEFASMYDPQPFHLSDEEASKSFFGRLVASGWHSAAVTMKLMVESGFFRGIGLVGLGVDELRWPRPVLPGDVVRVRAEVVENTPTKSGNRARIRWATTLLNQRDEVALTFTSTSLFPGRPR